MPRYLIKRARIGPGGAAMWHRAPFAHVEAASPEDAAAQAVEDMGGDRSQMQAADPIDGMSVYRVAGWLFVVETLTPKH